jgi:hypothetical protein
MNFVIPCIRIKSSVPQNEAYVIELETWWLQMKQKTG